MQLDSDAGWSNSNDDDIHIYDHNTDTDSQIYIPEESSPRSRASDHESQVSKISNKGSRSSLRASFRLSRKRHSKLHIAWGCDEHEVGSVHRQRRLSEQSLSRVMRDANIRSQFECFMDSENVGHVLRAWVALKEFEERSEIERKRKASHEWAQKLFDEYLHSKRLDDTENRLKSILSCETIDDLACDLVLDKNERITQTDIGIIENAFRVLHLKIHNVLKYEFLPGFLISEQFQSLYKDFQTQDLQQHSAHAQSPPVVPAMKISVAVPPKPQIQHVLNPTNSNANTETSMETNHSIERRDSADLKSSPTRGISQGGGSIKSIDDYRSECFGSLSRGDSVREATELLQDNFKINFFNEFIFTARSLHEEEDANMDLQEAPTPDTITSDKYRTEHRRRSHILGQQLELVEVHDELQALCDPEQDENAKLRRLNRMLFRYASPTQTLIRPSMPSLDALYSQLTDQGSVRVVEIPSNLDDLLAPVREEILSRIGFSLLPAFKQSSTYRKMLRRSSSSMCSEDFGALDERRLSSTSLPSPFPLSPATGPISTLSALSPTTGDTIANLECLQTYSENVTGKPSLFGYSTCVHDEVNLDEVLSSSYGSFQLKRFARKYFQEENVLFLVKTRQFRKNVHSANKSDLYELLHFAQEICSQFIAPGSPLEINISDSQRRNTLDEFEVMSKAFFDGLKGEMPTVETSKLTHLFDVAYQEIRTIVLRGLWDDFRRNAAYAEYCRKRVPMKVLTSTDATSGLAQLPRMPFSLDLSKTPVLE